MSGAVALPSALQRSGWLLPLLALLLFTSAARAEVVALSAMMQGEAASADVLYLEDAQKQYTIAQLQSEPLASAFAPLPQGKSHFGISGSDYWLRIDLHNPLGDELRWFLEARYPQWDRVSFYVDQQAGDQAAPLHLGDHLPFTARPVASEGFILPLQAPAGATQRIWVHFSYDQPGLAETELRLWTPDAFYQSYAKRYWLIGAFVGIGVVLFLYNLFIGYSTRMYEFIWYTSYVLAAVIAMLSINGLGTRYLWPDAVWLSDLAPVLFSLLTVVLATQFTRSFLSTAKASRLLDRGLQAVFVIAALSLLAYGAGARDVAVKLLLISALMTALYPLIGLWQYRQGRLEARFYVIGWSVWSLAMVVAVLRSISLIPSDAITMFTPPFGFTIEAVLLSFALADRIKRLKSEKEEMEQMHVDHLEREQETLTRVVRERTASLEEAKQRAESMARTDALTGVLNRRAFFEDAERELARAINDDAPVAVVMIDIDHFKAINDQYGHAAGDVALINVSRHLQSMVRRVDRLGRIGGEEFVLLLPQTALDTACELAERIRAELEASDVMAGEATLRITASFGVAAIEAGENIDNTLKRADEALYRAKNSGRNRVERAEVLS